MPQAVASALNDGLGATISIKGAEPPTQARAYTAGDCSIDAAEE